MTFATSSFAPWLQAAHIAGMRRGVEKEGLRMASDGYAAKTPHPKGLGSKLTHPNITTDYSENLLELITDPADTVEQCLDQLTKLHVLVHQNLAKGELVWPLSMPCMLSDGDEDIPLADYGRSNIGKLKTLYRSGLGVRYGRKMQTIAGVHYNVSFGDALFAAWQDFLGDTRPFVEFKNAGYLALIRNVKRLTPLILYLTGASPAVCACFVKGKKHDLIALNEQKTSYHLPFATSLRMGKLGYTNSAQKALDIRYNRLDEYIAGLKKAVGTPFAPFTAIGVDDAAGNPIQINDHILQIENEFYSPIRPKQSAHTNETPTDALKARGIAYVEFRAVDLDPYTDIGLSEQSACFLECLALYCLLSPSPPLLDDEEERIARNVETAVNQGRKKDACVLTEDGRVDLRSWIQSHLAAASKAADVLDAHYRCKKYSLALEAMQNRVRDDGATLAARVLKDSLAFGGVWKFGAHLAKSHQAALLCQSLNQSDAGRFADLAQTSRIDQANLEKDDTPFADFLAPFRFVQSS